MAAVPVLVDPPIWCAMVGEEHQASVVALRRAGKQIESGIVVEQKVARVARLGADDIWALYWVAAKEDWEVLQHTLVIASVDDIETAVESLTRPTIS